MATKPDEVTNDSTGPRGPQGPSIDGFREGTVERHLNVEGQTVAGDTAAETSIERAIASRAADTCIEASYKMDAAMLQADAKNPIDRDKSRMHNIIGGAISFGLALMIIILMALVTGYFVAEVPNDGAFSDSINTTTSIGGTGFVIFGVVLLAVPVVALVGYFLRSGLGGFITGGMGR